VGYDPNIFYARASRATARPTVKPARCPSRTLPDDAYDLTSPTDSDITFGDSRHQVLQQRGHVQTQRRRQRRYSRLGHRRLRKLDGDGAVPYRTHALNSSTRIFGLPETMSIGSFTRSGTTVTVTSVEPHGLTTSDKVYVPTTTSEPECHLRRGDRDPQSVQHHIHLYERHHGNLHDPGERQLPQVRGRQFHAQQRHRHSGQHAHGLATGDVVTTFIATSNAMNATSVTITFTNADRFTYTVGSGSTAVTAGSWCASGLYNVPTSVSGTALAYRITPVEYCSDVNLTTCTLATTPGTAPAGLSQPGLCALLQDAGRRAHAEPGDGDLRLTRDRALPEQVRQLARLYLHQREIRPVHPRKHHFGGLVHQPARPRRLHQQTDLQRGRGAAELRALVGLLPHPDPDDQDGRRTLLRRLHRQYEQHTPEAEPAAGGLDHDSRRRQRLGVDEQVPEDRELRHRAGFELLHHALCAGPQRGHAVAGSAVARGLDLCGQARHGLTNGIPAADDPMQSSCQRNFSILQTDGYWNGANGQTFPEGRSPTGTISTP